MTERAQRIMRAYQTDDTYDFPKDGVVSAIRELVNQLQHAPGVIMIADVLELCDELEAL
jgi:hypothetical protein